MTVQELFQTTLDTNKRKEEFVKYYLRYIANDIKGRNKKQKLLKLVNDICNCKDIKIDENSILFFIPDYPTHDNEDCINNFLIHKDELFEQENIIDSTNIKPYSYEFRPMKEVLGYQVSQACLYCFRGKYRALSSILYEMTFCGYDMESQENNATIKMEEINEKIDSIESDENSTFINWKALEESITKKHRIKFNKPKFEKLFDEEYMQIENIFLNSLTDKLYSLERCYIRGNNSNNDERK